MLRSFYGIAVAAVVLMAGCNPGEVKEVPPADEASTPKIPEDERQKYLDAGKKQAEEALKRKKEMESGGKKAGK